MISVVKTNYLADKVILGIVLVTESLNELGEFLCVYLVHIADVNTGQLRIPIEGCFRNRMVPVDHDSTAMKIPNVNQNLTSQPLELFFHEMSRYILSITHGVVLTIDHHVAP